LPLIGGLTKSGAGDAPDLISRAAEGLVSTNKLYQPLGKESRTWGGSSAGYRLVCLAIFVLGAALLSSSAPQENAAPRKFSANVLMRMAAEKTGKRIGARVYVK
jgi:hypothetical protein